MQKSKQYKNSISNILFLFLNIFILASSVVAQTTTSSKVKVVSVNTQKSVVEWIGRKIVGQHNGTINIKEGSLITKNNLLAGGSFVIDMKSIVCTDITDENYSKKLVQHLNNEDFFNVEQFPTATLKITKVLKIKNKSNSYNLSADLTVKGITKSITFPATFKKTGNVFEGNASITIDRTLWDIKYGSANFFEGLGDKAIKNDIELKVSIASN